MSNILQRLREVLARDLERHRAETDAVREEIADLKDELKDVLRKLSMMSSSVQSTNDHQTAIQSNLNQLEARFNRLEQSNKVNVARMEMTVRGHLENPEAHDPNHYDLLEALVFKLGDKCGLRVEEP